MSHAAPPEGNPTPSRLTIVTLLLIDPKRKWTPKEIEKETGLSRRVVARAIEALHDSRRLVKIPDPQRTYHVRLTKEGVQQCTRWLGWHITPELILKMSETKQGAVIAFTYALTCALQARR